MIISSKWPLTPPVQTLLPVQWVIFSLIHWPPSTSCSNWNLVLSFPFLAHICHPTSPIVGICHPYHMVVQHHCFPWITCFFLSSESSFMRLMYSWSGLPITEPHPQAQGLACSSCVALWTHHWGHETRGPWLARTVSQGITSPEKVPGHKLWFIQHRKQPIHQTSLAFNKGWVNCLKPTGIP